MRHSITVYTKRVSVNRRGAFLGFEGRNRLQQQEDYTITSRLRAADTTVVWNGSLYAGTHTNGTSGTLDDTNSGRSIVLARKEIIPCGNW